MMTTNEKRMLAHGVFIALGAMAIGFLIGVTL